MRILSFLAFIGGVAAVVGFQNCGVPGINVQPGGDGSSIAVDQKTLTTLNIQDLSCGTDSDCEGLTYGSKACGGPTHAIVVSKLNPRYSEILKLAEEITAQEHAFNQATGAISTCDMLMAPVPKCVSNTCQ